MVSTAFVGQTYEHRHILIRRSRALKIITWNIAGRTNGVSQQIEEIHAHRPEIIALQEVRLSSLSSLRGGLVAHSLIHIYDSFQFAIGPKTLTGPRQFGELIASCHPIEPITPGRLTSAPMGQIGSIG